MSATTAYPAGMRPWLMWGLGALFFFTMYIARVSPGVMSIPLMEDFQVSAFALGSLSAFFFYPYVIMQVPVGLLVDRFSTRWLLTAMVLLCALACYLFGSATSLTMASASRFVLGFSAAFGFVGALKLASVWFSPHRFGLLAGLTQAIGMLGAAIGQNYVAVGVETIGWRSTLYVIGGALAVLAVIIALFVRDYPPQHEARSPSARTSGRDILRSMGKVFANPQTWINGLCAGLIYAPTAAFAELWGNSFLTRAYGLDLTSAAWCIGLIFIGWGIGGPLMGWLSDTWGRRRPFMWFSAASCCVLLTVILYVPELPLFLLYTCLFAFGMLNAGVVVAYAVAGEINSRRVAGTSLGVANMLSIIIGAAYQPLVGWLLDLSRGGALVTDTAVYTVENYRWAFLILPLSLVAAFISIFFIKETYCEPLESVK